FGGPAPIHASVPGTGDGGAADILQPHSYKVRSALALVNGVVYTDFTSHCDFTDLGAYHGWLIGYNADAVTEQVGVFNVTPDGSAGSIWSSGDAPSVDEKGNLYVETSNGSFDADKGGRDYGDSILKLSGAGTPNLTVADYFTPANQDNLSNNDQDVGSAGQALLPASYGNSDHPHLLTGADKTGEVYLLDRDKLGGYRKGKGGSNAVIQEFHAAPKTNSQCFSTPACFNGFVYWSMVGDSIKAYRLQNGRYLTRPSSQTFETFDFPGCVPSVSSNGNRDGILWAIQSGKTGVLRAYDAADLDHELYNSAQAAKGRDRVGSPSNKFTPPTIVNGKVYVPTTDNLVVYGLLHGHPHRVKGH
ncbi:MAG TPA: pyrrolo-quinoline quinone, partial [bacterium]|nr:pyrrolo-quinoline quinone [bacterium]